MNLWVNRIGQLTFLSVALFFFVSCKEDVSVLGYKNPNTKFKVNYYEIPLESSVMLEDSLRTSNFSFYAEPSRFLVGSYNDDRFGSVTSTAVAQYFTTTAAKLDASAIYDSVSLQLQFDLYHYGPTTRTPQTYSIYKLEDQLDADNKKYFFNKTPITTGEFLGSNSYVVDTDDFDEFAQSSTDYDTVITINIPLKYSFGRAIFASAERYRDNEQDTVFITDSLFFQQFKGLVIKPESTDKAIGFTPGAAATRLVLHYHTTKDTTTLPLALVVGAAFNQIKADRGATELAQVTEYHREYLQESDTRYIQSGTGIMTKVDFTNFYDFIDSIPNIFVNSAELVVENVESGSLAPPTSLVLRNLNPKTNRFREYKLSNAQDTVDYKSFRGFFQYDFATGNSPALIDDDFIFYARGDKTNSMTWSSSKHSYSGVYTLLLQQMCIRGDNRSQLTSFVLYPGSDLASKVAFTSGAKSLNRAIFPRTGIKLRVYYTKPLDAQ